MSKELEDLINFINTLLNARLSDKHFINVANNETWLELSNIKLALLELQSIKEANPSEALECLEKIIDNLDDYADFEIKQEANEYIDTIKQSLLKAQEPKQYLKWEDLEFEENKHNLKCKMNDSLYYIEWFIDGMGFKTVNIYLDVNKDYLEYCIYLQGDKKQFFNDLHLERVEE